MTKLSYGWIGPLRKCIIQMWFCNTYDALKYCLCRQLTRAHEKDTVWCSECCITNVSNGLTLTVCWVINCSLFMALLGQMLWLQSTDWCNYKFSWALLIVIQGKGQYYASLRYTLCLNNQKWTLEVHSLMSGVHWDLLISFGCFVHRS